ncbi:MAG: hypothetical protein IT556_05815 [Acetobacteraceae bacterium]|nr:hypothetical protein [Acetobacteraceae bacterium]
MTRLPLTAAAIAATLAAAGCAPGMGGLSSPPSRGAASTASAQASGLPDSVIAACRAEAERATVQQNRGELMRLDEAENRGRDSLMQNQTERGLLMTRRDQLYRECLARAARQMPAAAAPAAAATPATRAPGQTTVPR